jgi:hypothetical protein
MTSVNMECVVFKALCQQVKYLQGIKRPLKASMHDVSYNVKKITGDDKWYMGSDLWLDANNAKRFYAICYSLERKGMVRIIKGSRSRTTRIEIADKGWEYINKLKQGRAQQEKDLVENSTDCCMTCGKKVADRINGTITPADNGYEVLCLECE